MTRSRISTITAVLVASFLLLLLLSRTYQPVEPPSETADKPSPGPPPADVTSSEPVAQLREPLKLTAAGQPSVPQPVEPQPIPEESIVTFGYQLDMDTFMAEEVDLEWAARTENALYASLADAQFDVYTVNVECRSQNCLIELTADLVCDGPEDESQAPPAGLLVSVIIMATGHDPGFSCSTDSDDVTVWVRRRQ